ncbi:MAG: AMP-binding protein [Gemmatimonadota bacterium]
MAQRVDVTQLTPLLFLERSAQVFPDKPAITYGARSLTYAEFGAAAQEAAGGLEALGAGEGDRVAYLMPNVPEMLIAHYAVPLLRGILVAINTRLAGPEIAYILEHSGATILVADTQLLAGVAPHLAGVKTLKHVVQLPAGQPEHREGSAPGDGAQPIDLAVPTTSYADMLAASSGAARPWSVDDELRPISVNYTSGTTGRPKGVQYTHRGAYLNAIGELLHSEHSPETVYLWTLPMFHCNGWCTTWAVTAYGGRHVCLRAVDPAEIWRLIRAEGVTHLNAAPTVLIGMANHPDAATIDRPFTVTTAGAPPSPTLIRQMEAIGIRMVHMYGLTETYGPYTVCEWQPGWEDLALDDRAELLSRQGVAFIGADPIRVVDEEMSDVARDGETMGEVVMRGNNVMAGYYADPEATETAFRGDWFHSGDLAVWHPDGYIELRDRAKDIIISGGENISTIEVEKAVVSHPAVLEAAVVAVPHEKWGERPKAFVVLKSGARTTGEEIIDHVRGQIARYKAPDRVDIVDALPKTSTGKIQKYVLREAEWEGRGKRIN